MDDFEFDENKSRLNALKHSIDFIEAQKLWQDLDLAEINANSKDEPRYIAIGLIKGKFWTAICTKRKHRIRIISVRRSRKDEVALYESKRL